MRSKLFDAIGRCIYIYTYMYMRKYMYIDIYIYMYINLSAHISKLVCTPCCLCSVRKKNFLKALFEKADEEGRDMRQWVHISESSTQTKVAGGSQVKISPRRAKERRHRLGRIPTLRKECRRRIPTKSIFRMQRRWHGMRGACLSLLGEDTSELGWSVCASRKPGLSPVPLLLSATRTTGSKSRFHMINPCYCSMEQTQPMKLGFTFHCRRQRVH